MISVLILIALSFSPGALYLRFYSVSVGATIPLFSLTYAITGAVASTRGFKPTEEEFLCDSSLAVFSLLLACLMSSLRRTSLKPFFSCSVIEGTPSFSGCGSREPSQCQPKSF